MIRNARRISINHEPVVVAGAKTFILLFAKHEDFAGRHNSKIEVKKNIFFNSLTTSTIKAVLSIILLFKILRLLI